MKLLRTVRWLLRRSRFLCWYAGHRSVESLNSRVCTRCWKAEWLW